MVEPTVSVTTIPERVGRYEIILPIASGGMATVYLARSNGAGGFSRQIALKLTHAHLRDNPEFTNDLLEEAMLASGVRHPNVVPVLEVDQDPLGMYLIMEYVEGETLGGLRRKAAAAKRGLAPAVGMRMLLDALAGLHAAHELRDENGELVNLVHRDFSPQNIIIGVDGTARLTDFGIAKAASRLGHTRTGLVKGKISYMAPEQARSLPLDRRCDVWAAGVIAWEILAQRRLHPGGDGDVGTLLKVVSEEPPLLRSIVPAIPVEIERVIARALKIDRDQRFSSALAMSRDLMSACRSVGLLADHDEVAAFLGETVGSKLAERRGRAAEVLRLRSKMGAPGSSKENDERLAKDIQDAIRPLAEMLEPESDMEIEAAIAPLLPPTRLSPLLSLNDSAELRIAAMDHGERTTGSASSVSLPGDHTRPEPASRMRVSPWLFLAGASILAFGVAIGAAMRPRGGPVATPAPEAAAMTVAVAPTTPTVVATPATRAPVAGATQAASGRALEAEAPRVAPGTVLVHANAPVSELDVDGRPVSLAIATREPLLELSSEERGRTIRVTARSSDGRESTLVVLPGIEEIAIEFAARPKPPPTRPGPPTRTRH